MRGEYYQREGEMGEQNDNKVPSDKSGQGKVLKLLNLML